MKPWNPISGKLYQNLHEEGFLFNAEPKPSSYYRVFVKPENIISYGEIFLFVGGPGSCQKVPEHYWAYKILWGEKLGWLIYPIELQNEADAGLRAFRAYSTKSNPVPPKLIES